MNILRDRIVTCFQLWIQLITSTYKISNYVTDIVQLWGKKKTKHTGKYMKNSVKKWTSLLYVCISYSRNSMIVIQLDLLWKGHTLVLQGLVLIFIHLLKLIIFIERLSCARKPEYKYITGIAQLWVEHIYPQAYKTVWKIVLHYYMCVILIVWILS